MLNAFVLQQQVIKTDLEIVIRAPASEARKLRKAWAKIKSDRMPGGSSETEISMANMFGVKWRVEEL